MSKLKKNSWEKDLILMLSKVQEASKEASLLSSADKNRILHEVAADMKKAVPNLLAANARDLKAARKNNLNSAMIDRLTLTPARIAQMAEGVKTVAKLEDPIGKLLGKWERPNGLEISRVSVPLGVILIIYESRPNVTVECAALCLKSGNAVILRGGKEAFYTNQVLAALFTRVLKRRKIPEACVSIVKTTDRAAVDFLLHREKEIHLVIPRGGESLIRKVVEMSRIPVIKHYQGICHVYVDEKADLKKAAAIAVNAKLQRPGVCNAMETLLVNRKIAASFLSVLSKSLEGKCEIRADQEVRRWIPWAKKAKPDDFGREFLDKILAVKVVGGLDEAVKHIGRFGSGHTDAIITENKRTAEKFVLEVDSSSVMVNASTRFADGFEYGLGAEIGISTDKIHARGPMGLEGLTSYKYVVRGDGQIRS